MKHNVAPKVREELRINNAAFAKAAFPHVFRSPWNSFHRSIFDAFATYPDGRPIHNRVCIAAPRGLGKTSLVLFAFLAADIVFGRTTYAVYMGASQNGAIEKTEDLRRQLEQSEMVQALTGGIDPGALDDAGAGLPYSREAWTAKCRSLVGVIDHYDGTRVIPRGSDQTVRGRGAGASRVTTAIGDDIDDPEKVKSDLLRGQIAQRWLGDVVPAMDQYSPENCRAVYIGTWHSDNCLLAQLMDDEDWYHVKLPVCDGEFRTLCPEFMPQERLDALIRQYKRLGQFEVFAREYMMAAADPETVAFKAEHFRRYEERELRREHPNVENVVIVDPARVEGKSACETAIIGVGIDRNGTAWIRDLDAGRWEACEQATRAVDMALSLGARTLYVEDNGLGTYAQSNFDHEIAKRGACGVRFEGINASKTQKDARILSVGQWFRQGRVLINSTIAERIEAQLLSWRPGAKHKAQLIDIADVVGYIPKIAEKLNAAPSAGSSVTAGEWYRRQMEQSEPALVRRVHSWA